MCRNRKATAAMKLRHAAAMWYFGRTRLSPDSMPTVAACELLWMQRASVPRSTRLQRQAFILLVEVQWQGAIP